MLWLLSLLITVFHRNCTWIGTFVLFAALGCMPSWLADGFFRHPTRCSLDAQLHIMGLANHISCGELIQTPAAVLRLAVLLLPWPHFQRAAG